jgi:acarbose 7IV-phosphotransferase
MSKILVSGLINLETTLQIDQFPLNYYPVRYPFGGINTTVSGVGYNVAKALTILGNTVHLLALIGKDPASQLVQRTLQEDHLAGIYVLPQLKETPQSVILYDHEGRRQIHVDLKNTQEQGYPEEFFERARQGCSLAVLCNINFSRTFLKSSKHSGLWIATDVHAIRDLEDSYNGDFMESADILFMSDENLNCSPEEWVKQIQNRYGPEIIVIGLGAKGVLLAVRSSHFMERLPAVTVRPIGNTIGAGDALFSCFIHFFLNRHDPYDAIRNAIFFAAYKIGASGAADGFLNEQELVKLIQEFSRGSS